MKSPRVTRVILMTSALSAAFGGPVAAQAPDAQARGQWTVSGGIFFYGTGGSGCADAYGVAPGLEVNTTGNWLLGLGLGLLDDVGPDECISIGRLGLYEGRHVELRGGVRYRYAPQVTLRAGRALRVGRAVVEPALAGGYLREYGHWRQWYGGSMRLAFGTFPLSLQIDRGRHPVTLQFVEDRQVLQEYRRWEPITVISLRW